MMKSYKITSKLREDAKYEIYHAVHESDNTLVILKTFKSSHPSSHAINQLKAEFALLGNLHHPYIIKAKNIEPIEDKIALVLEDVTEKSLFDYVHHKPLGLPNFFNVVLPLVEAVKHLHSKRIIHKNINPHDILVDSSLKEIKLAGFDFASEFGRESQEANINEAFEAGLTYISPEQTGRMNRAVDHRSDLYALGVVFYELLTGYPPFKADDPMKMIHYHIAVPPLEIHTIEPTIPIMLSQIVRKLLAKSAEERYQSAIGLLHDLQICQSEIEKSGEVSPFALGQKDVSDLFIIPEKLYGREKELNKLMQVYEGVKEGGSGMVWIAGYSGVGKSRLVKEVEKKLSQEQAFFIQGKFEMFKQNVPLGPLLAAFRELILQLLAGSNAQIAQWKNEILGTVGANGQIIIDVLPELELLIGKQKAVPELPPLEANNRFNQIFNSFVRVFAKKEHPLCIFLDDLQWIDSTTIQWIENQLKDQNLLHFFFIGAYRANETSDSHPLMLLKDRLVRNQIQLQTIDLQPLNKESANRLIADTIVREQEECRELTEIILQKTDGNPFFLRQCLLSLYDKNAIQFSYEKAEWTFDIEKVRNASISDNVIELMTELFQRLAHEVQDTIKKAACIGSQFDIDLLSQICEQGVTQTDQELNEAIKLGLLIPLHQKNEDYTAAFAFQHDRIQQTALSLLGDDEKKAIQLKLGRFLLNQKDEAAIENNLYEIANNLNAALDLITDAEERRKLVDINLEASIRAKKATAYQPALDYITKAMTILPTQQWASPSELTKDLYLQRAISEHLCGNDSEAEGFFEKAVSHAVTAIEKGKVYVQQIHYYINIRKFKEAYQTARKGTKPLGVILPAQFFPPQLLADFVTYRILKGNRKIQDFINIEEMKSENLKMAVMLISTVGRAAYQIRPELCVAVCNKIVNICLKHGNTDGGFIGFLAFGPIFQGAILGNRKVGFEFGQLILALVEKYKSTQFKPETHFVVGYFAMPWLRPVSEMEKYWEIAYNSGLEVGDFFHASCAACATIQSYFSRGMNFDQIMESSDRFLDFLNRIGNQEAIDTLDAVRQSIRNLRGETESFTSYNTSEFDEAKYLQRLSQFGSRHFAHYYFINKMTTLYLWGEYQKAFETSKLSDQYLGDSPGMLHTSEHYFYKGLVAAACYYEAEGSKRGKFKKILAKTIQLFKKYTAGCAPNFIHKYQLLQGEYSRMEGDLIKSQAFFEEAIESANQYGYLHIQAIAHELLGKLYYQNQRYRSATFYLKDAIYCFQKLGASAYANFILQKYPEVQFRMGQVQSTPFSSGAQVSSLSTNIANYDLLTMLKSSEAISKEIRLKDLLSTLSKIIIENAGAQRMVFLLKEGESLVVQAECLAGDNKQVQFLPLIPLEEYPDIAQSMVNYVFNTQEPVIVDDATASGNFTKDAYITSQKPRSILCAPLLKQGEIIGVLYLENNLTNGAFTQERIDLLILLSGQMAISIDNALLYDNLEEKVKERTIKLNETVEELNQSNEEIAAQRDNAEALSREIAKKNEDITASIVYAKRIQQAILPLTEQLDKYLPEYFILFRPREVVSGDFYYFNSIGNQLILAAVDCTGHGVPGAFMSLIGNEILEEITTYRHITSPEEILEELNRGIRKTLKQGERDTKDGMDIALVSIDMQQNILEFSGAHNPIVYIQNETLYHIKGDNMPIGGSDERIKPRDFQKHTIPMESDTCFYLFSDGYQDQFGGADKRKFMIKRLKELLLQIHQLPMHEQQSILNQTIEDWIIAGREKQIDDILVIGVRWRGK